MSENCLKQLINDLKKNTKNRSESSINNFRYFMNLFLKYFNVDINDLYEKKIKIDIKEQDINCFIHNRSKSFIFFLEYICKTYLNKEISAYKEIKRYNDNMNYKKLEERNFNRELKKEKGTPYLTINELELLYDSINEKEKIFFLFLITTGIRRGALKQCKYNNIDFEKEIITTIEKGKIETEYLLTPELLYLLKKHKNIFEFFNNDYKIGKIINNFKIIIDRKDLHPHLFRFTFSRLVLNNLNNVKEIQTLLNHSNLQTTQTSYIKETRLDKMKRMNLSWIRKQEKTLPYFLESGYINKFYELLN